VPMRLDYRECKRRGENRGEKTQQDASTLRTKETRQGGGRGDDERPQQVDLSLSRQCPEVLQWACGLALLEIIHRIERKLPVLDVKDGGERLADRLVPQSARQPEHRCDRDGEQDEHRRRQQAARQSTPELHEVDAPRRFELAQERPRYQQSGYD